MTSSTSLAKIELPIIYNDLLNDLRKYRRGREDLNFIEKIIYDEKLTRRRIEIATILIHKLEESDFSYLENYTSIQMQNIGSAKVLEHYSSLQKMLITQNAVNNRLSKEEKKLLKGKLNSILVKYLAVASKNQKVFMTYLMHQSTQKRVFTEAQYVSDSVEEAMGLAGSFVVSFFKISKMK